MPGKKAAVAAVALMLLAGTLAGIYFFTRPDRPAGSQAHEAATSDVGAPEQEATDSEPRQPEELPQWVDLSGEAPADVEFKTHVQAGLFAIQYPADWELATSGGTYEMVAFQTRRAGDRLAGHGGQDEDSVKVAISLHEKDGKTLEQIIQTEYSYGLVELLSREDSLVIGGLSAVRLYSIDGEYGDRQIDLFIDYSATQYIEILAWTNDEPEADRMVRIIKHMHETFEPLK